MKKNNHKNWKKELRAVLQTLDDSTGRPNSGEYNNRIVFGFLEDFFQNVLESERQLIHDEVVGQIKIMPATIHTPVGGYSNIEWLMKRNVVQKIERIIKSFNA